MKKTTIMYTFTLLVCSSLLIYSSLVYQPTASGTSCVAVLEKYQKSYADAVKENKLLTQQLEKEKGSPQDLNNLYLEKFEDAIVMTSKKIESGNKYLVLPGIYAFTVKCKLINIPMPFSRGSVYHRIFTTWDTKQKQQVSLWLEVLGSIVNPSPYPVGTCRLAVSNGVDNFIITDNFIAEESKPYDCELLFLDDRTSYNINVNFQSEIYNIKYTPKTAKSIGNVIMFDNLADKASGSISTFDCKQKPTEIMQTNYVCT